MSVLSETILHGKSRADALCNYVSRGWSVFPVPPGTKKSYKSAEQSDGRAWGMTRDPDEICRDFTRWPDAGIGIPTGAVNGIVVVETDTVAGRASTDENVARRTGSQVRRIARNAAGDQPSGSVHRYFKHPAGGIKINVIASEIGRGIDIRAMAAWSCAANSQAGRWGLPVDQSQSDRRYAGLADRADEGKQPPKRSVYRSESEPSGVRRMADRPLCACIRLAVWRTPPCNH